MSIAAFPEVEYYCITCGMECTIMSRKFRPYQVTKSRVSKKIKCTHIVLCTNPMCSECNIAYENTIEAVNTLQRHRP
jgi:hypothetical protein